MNHNLEVVSFPDEEWRVIKKAPNYLVSNYGRVFSLRRNKLRSLSSRTNKGRGYAQIDLWADGTPYNGMVHRLVAEAFIGEIPDGMQVCHNDGNPENNHVSNLRIDTPKSNQADRKRHGTEFKGETIPWAKVSELDVKIMRHLDERPTCSQSDIARVFGVSKSIVKQACAYKTWRHVGRLTHADFVE